MTEGHFGRQGALVRASSGNGRETLELHFLFKQEAEAALNPTCQNLKLKGARNSFCRNIHRYILWRSNRSDGCVPVGADCARSMIQVRTQDSEVSVNLGPVKPPETLPTQRSGVADLGGHDSDEL